jgi:hypothetical protein
MDAATRADVLGHLQQLDVTLSSDATMIAAWRDLVSSCQKLHRTVEEVSFRRDTLWAIAHRRGLNIGDFGVFRDVCAVLTDDANAVRCEQDRAAEFHDYRPYPAMAGKGFVELGEPVEKFPSDNGFGIERYPPHFAERREVGCLFGMRLHLASVGRRPRRVGRKNRLGPPLV